MSINEVFVSYSGDRDDRVHLVRALKEHGIRPWRDVEDLPLGEDTTEEIGRVLGTCSGVILWINERALESDFIRNVEAPRIVEARTDRGIRIVSVSDGFPIGAALEKFESATGYALGGQNGHEIDRRLRPEVEARALAARYVAAHVGDCSNNEHPAVIRVVTRDDTAAHRDDAVLNFDWRHLLADGWPTDHAIADAFDAQRHAVTRFLAAYGSGDVTLAVKANLPVAVALGHALRRTTGAVPSMEGAGFDWRPVDHSDGTPLEQKQLPAGSAAAVQSCLEVHVSNDVSDAVTDTIQQIGTRYRRRDILVPEHGPGQTALSDNAQANAWARQVRDTIRELSSERGVSDVDLFYSGPVELGVLIGWWLNAAGRVHVHEYRHETQTYRPMWVTPSG
jgi:hypothetical protein